MPATLTEPLTEPFSEPLTEQYMSDSPPEQGAGSKGACEQGTGAVSPDVSLDLNKRSARDASGQAKAQVMSA